MRIFAYPNRYLIFVAFSKAASFWIVEKSIDIEEGPVNCETAGRRSTFVLEDLRAYFAVDPIRSNDSRSFKSLSVYVDASDVILFKHVCDGSTEVYLDPDADHVPVHSKMKVSSGRYQSRESITG